MWEEDGGPEACLIGSRIQEGHSGVASNEPISLHSSHLIILMCVFNICLVLCLGFQISIEIIENF